MTDLDKFMEEDHSGDTHESFFYEYSQVDDTFTDLESEGNNVVVTDLALLPAQIEFMEDTTSRTVGYVGGFGSGVGRGFF